MPKRKLGEFISEFAKALSDINFNHIVTTRMLPTIYVAGIIFAALLALSLAVSSWESNSWPARLIWSFIFSPMLFIGLVTIWRVILELCLSIFEMTVVVRSLHTELEKVSGVTDEIATDLPRIQFWKTRKQSNSSKNQK
jgi:hypothetical protein